MDVMVSSDLKLESSNNNIQIEKIKYNNGKVIINNDTSIIGICEEGWNFCIGSYQIIDKWLKNRKDESLSFENFELLKRIVGIIEETIKLQNNL
jgi:hypothetical protein